MDELKALITRLEAVQAELARGARICQNNRSMLAEGALAQATSLTRHAIDVLKQHTKGK
jgi:hypothetical protein